MANDHRYRRTAVVAGPRGMLLLAKGHRVKSIVERFFFFFRSSLNQVKSCCLSAILCDAKLKLILDIIQDFESLSLAYESMMAIIVGSMYI
ncbi:hypothetical protein APHAL10511_000843 [Amanita phalloides]|nr:hypothetical protein APHAL10511_000843 [Amanita phalloides]